MTELHVGGFNLRHRYKSLEQALAKARVGDVINLHKNEKIKSIIVDKAVTINGNNNTIQIEKGFAGIKTQRNLKLQDVNFKIDSEANGIVVDADGVDLILKNVTFQYEKKTDPRDWYSAIVTYDDSSVVIDGSHVPFMNSAMSYLKINNSTLGSVFGKASAITPDVIESNNTVFDNIEIVSLGGRFTNTVTYGGLSIYGLSSEEASEFILENLSFVKYDKPSNIYRKSFKDMALYKDSIIGIQLVDAVFNIDTITEDSVDTAYKFSAIHVERASVELVNDESFSIHSATNSAISSTSDIDWNLIGDSILSNPTTVGAGESGAYQKIQELIGLDSVKSQLDKFLSTARIRAEQKRRGIEEKTDFMNHMVFVGPAGTGKTTVAHYLAAALVEEHVLRENKVVVVGSEDLVSKWVGETKTKTHNVVLSALGGILFIDEAYSLLPRGENNHNQDAVDQLVEDATKYKDDLIIIMAGYDADMKNFIEVANAGLKSRFTHWIDFEPYSFENLLAILKLKAKNSGTIISAETFKMIAVELLKFYKQNVGPNGLDGNGRYIENVLRDLIDARNSRISGTNIASLSNDDLMTITNDDVISVFR